MCVWVGPDEARPSRSLPAARIAERLSEGWDGLTLGRRCGAIALGATRARCSLGSGLEDWQRLGAAFRQWPADVLSICCRGQSDIGRLLAASRACPTLTRDAMAMGPGVRVPRAC